MSSRGSVTVGSSIHSANTREGPNPPQGADSAGENGTGSEGCSETDTSGTMYSTDVSEGVARRGRARYRKYKGHKPY